MELAAHARSGVSDNSTNPLPCTRTAPVKAFLTSPGSHPSALDLLINRHPVPPRPGTMFPAHARSVVSDNSSNPLSCTRTITVKPLLTRPISSQTSLPSRIHPLWISSSARSPPPRNLVIHPNQKPFPTRHGVPRPCSRKARPHKPFSSQTYLPSRIHPPGIS